MTAYEAMVLMISFGALILVILCHFQKNNHPSLTS